MLLSFTDFTTRLAHGQLKNTAVVDDSDTGEINPGHEDQLLALTNQGLIDITTKKKLIEERAVLTFVTDQNVYILDTSPAATYENFVEVLQIEAVPTGNEVIEANKKVFVPKSTMHITKPSHESLRFSDQFMEDYAPSVDVVFQKHHAPILAAGNIDLPAHLIEALLLYVSGLYLSHMGGDQNTQKGDQYYGLYLKMMGEDAMTNASGVSELTDNDTRFADRGFV